MKNIFNRPQTNIELMDIAKAIGINLRGCFMKDELKGKINDGLYIINLENSDENGSHWTALYKKGTKYYYSDSFGVPLPQTLIDNLNIKSDKLFFNTVQIQDMKSVKCGFFALYFLWCMCIDKDVKDRIDFYLESFDMDNAIKNDILIKNIFSNLI